MNVSVSLYIKYFVLARHKCTPCPEKRNKEVTVF